GLIRVHRCSITALSAPNEDETARSSPNSSTAQAMMSSASRCSNSAPRESRSYSQARSVAMRVFTFGPGSNGSIIAADTHAGTFGPNHNNQRCRIHLRPAWATNGRPGGAARNFQAVEADFPIPNTCQTYVSGYTAHA